MKSILLASAIALITSPIYAGSIERACNKSDRKAANRAKCSCIQQVANVKLTRTEQRIAAKFFKDPQKAQDLRQSDKPSNERLWKRYKAWGNQAAKQCRA